MAALNVGSTSPGLSPHQSPSHLANSTPAPLALRLVTAAVLLFRAGVSAPVRVQFFADLSPLAPCSECTFPSAEKLAVSFAACP